ncbi:hypothetical protein ACJVDH_00475 [Pedobacter sp. AW1-32]|uniref:hypothetical protein n=1 Tax=Pedobacter sp. AW1-32 TaxID=3383026 RepID=UPI003FEE0EDA
MNTVKAATVQRDIKIGPDVISIEGVKGDDFLYRVSINKSFKGYLQKRDGVYHRLDGSDIHNLIFAKICQHLE